MGKSITKSINMSHRLFHGQSIPTCIRRDITSTVPCLHEWNEIYLFRIQ